jgi:hypothetical protein
VLPDYLDDSGDLLVISPATWTETVRRVAPYRFLLELPRTF